MEFKFTPRTVKEIEDVAGKGYQEVLSEYSLSNVVLFVRKGLGIDEKAAYKKIEEYLENEENNLPGLFLEITEAMQRDGFLPRRGLGEKELKEAKKALKGE